VKLQQVSREFVDFAGRLVRQNAISWRTSSKAASKRSIFGEIPVRWPNPIDAHPQRMGPEQTQNVAGERLRIPQGPSCNSLDGYGVLSVVRAEKLPTKVILVTARQQEQDILRGFQLGADDYLVKPFNLLELVARINRLLRQPSQAAA
jgi:hypothetical protein